MTPLNEWQLRIISPSVWKNTVRQNSSRNLTLIILAVIVVFLNWLLTGTLMRLSDLAYVCPPWKPFARLCLLPAVRILCSAAGNCVCGGISSPNWKWAILLLGLKAVGLEFCSLEVGKRGMVSLTTRLPGYGCFESCNGNQRHKCSSVPLRMQTTWACTPYVKFISATHCELSSLECIIKPLIHCYTKCTSLMISLCLFVCVKY